MRRKILVIIGVLCSLILFGLFAAFSFQKSFRSVKLPVIGEVRDFELIDTENKPFSLRDLQGRVWVADFFFTTCGDICPLMSKNMASLSRTFETVNGVTLVSISVNPEVDSPEVLAKYAQKYRVKKNKWRFLTGDREDIKDLALNSFKLGSIEEPMFHSDKFALVDRHGFIRGYYSGTETDGLNQIFKDAAALIRER